MGIQLKKKRRKEKRKRKGEKRKVWKNLRKMLIFIQRGVR
jgi:hypothetical protein